MQPVTLRGGDRWKHATDRTGSQMANCDFANDLRWLSAVPLRESRGSQRATSGVVSTRIIAVRCEVCGEWPFWPQRDRERRILGAANQADLDIARRFAS